MTKTTKNYDCVEVDLGDRRYPIHIGPNLIDYADQYIGALVQDRHVVIIADDALAESHLPRLKTSLKSVAKNLIKSLYQAVRLQNLLLYLVG